MSQIRPLIPLLVTAGILIGGNGLQATFISLRALQEGFSASTISASCSAESRGAEELLAIRYLSWILLDLNWATVNSRCAISNSK